MADELLQTEGDYEYWQTADGDGYRRYAKGNSKGKLPHALADVHPNARKVRLQRAAEGNTALEKLGPGALLRAAGRIARAEASLEAARDGVVRELRAEGHKVRTALEAWGLLAGRQAERALAGSPQAGIGVRIV